MFVFCRYAEMLLVPRSELTTDKKDAADLPPGGSESCGGGVEDMQEVMRAMMKQMVKRAVMPSPIKRTLSQVELERAHSVLYKMALTAKAEDATNIKALQGKHQGVLLQPIVSASRASG